MWEMGNVCLRRSYTPLGVGTFRVSGELNEFLTKEQKNKNPLSIRAKVSKMLV